MSVSAIQLPVNPFFYKTRFKKEATQSLSKIFQESLGATSEATITYNSKPFKVSIGAIILSSAINNYTYSMWDYSAAAHACFKTSDPPITEVKILSIICGDVYIKTSRYDPFRGQKKPGRHAI